MEPRRQARGQPPPDIALRDRLAVALVNAGLARDLASDPAVREQLRRAVDALHEAGRLLDAQEAAGRPVF